MTFGFHRSNKEKEFPPDHWPKSPLKHMAIEEFGWVAPEICKNLNDLTSSSPLFCPT